MEKLYNIYLDGEILDRNVTRQEADKLIDEYLEADENDGEDHFYSIKPVQIALL
jgi:hypothetical protein